MKEKRTFLLWFTLCVDFIKIQAVNFGPTPQKLSFKTNGTRAMSKPNNSIVSDQGKGFSRRTYAWKSHSVSLFDVGNTKRTLIQRKIRVKGAPKGVIVNVNGQKVYSSVGMSPDAQSVRDFLESDKALNLNVKLKKKPSKFEKPQRKQQPGIITAQDPAQTVRPIVVAVPAQTQPVLQQPAAVTPQISQPVVLHSPPLQPDNAPNKEDEDIASVLKTVALLNSLGKKEEPPPKIIPVPVPVPVPSYPPVQRYPAGMRNQGYPPYGNQGYPSQGYPAGESPNQGYPAGGNPNQGYPESSNLGYPGGGNQQSPGTPSNQGTPGVSLTLSGLNGVLPLLLPMNCRCGCERRCPDLCGLCRDVDEDIYDSIECCKPIPCQCLNFSAATAQHPPVSSQLVAAPPQQGPPPLPPQNQPPVTLSVTGPSTSQTQPIQTSGASVQPSATGQTSTQPASPPLSKITPVSSPPAPPLPQLSKGSLPSSPPSSSQEFRQAAPSNSLPLVPPLQQAFPSKPETTSKLSLSEQILPPQQGPPPLPPQNQPPVTLSVTGPSTSQTQPIQTSGASVQPSATGQTSTQPASPPLSKITPVSSPPAPPLPQLSKGSLPSSPPSSSQEFRQAAPSNSLPLVPPLQQAFPSKPETTSKLSLSEQILPPKPQITRPEISPKPPKPIILPPSTKPSSQYGNSLSSLSRSGSELSSSNGQPLEKTESNPSAEKTTERPLPSSPRMDYAYPVPPPQPPPPPPQVFIIKENSASAKDSEDSKSAEALDNLSKTFEDAFTEAYNSESKKGRHYKSRRGHFKHRTREQDTDVSDTDPDERNEMHFRQGTRGLDNFDDNLEDDQKMTHEDNTSLSDPDLLDEGFADTENEENNEKTQSSVDSIRKFANHSTTEVDNDDDNDEINSNRDDIDDDVDAHSNDTEDEDDNAENTHANENDEEELNVGLETESPHDLDEPRPTPPRHHFTSHDTTRRLAKKRRKAIVSRGHLGKSSRHRSDTKDRRLYSSHEKSKQHVAKSIVLAHLRKNRPALNDRDRKKLLRTNKHVHHSRKANFLGKGIMKTMFAHSAYHKMRTQVSMNENKPLRKIQTIKKAKLKLPHIHGRRHFANLQDKHVRTNHRQHSRRRHFPQHEVRNQRYSHRHRKDRTAQHGHQHAKNHFGLFGNSHTETRIKQNDPTETSTSDGGSVNRLKKNSKLVKYKGRKHYPNRQHSFKNTHISKQFKTLPVPVRSNKRKANKPRNSNLRVEVAYYSLGELESSEEENTGTDGSFSD